MKRVVSTCIYCGCGCKLAYLVEGNKIVRIEGYNKDDISDGKPCIKGLTINEVWNKNRIKKPLIREGDKLREVSWKEAIDKIVEHAKELEPNQIFMNGSGKITNEDNFALLKLGTCIFNTSNIDSCCGRLCHISTVKGLLDCYGTPNLTKISNLDKIDTLLIIGSNPAVNYPVFWNKILKRKPKLKIISIQSLLNLTSKFGDLFLEIEPGTEVALLNGIIHYLIKEKLFSIKASKVKNFRKLKKTVSRYYPSYVSKICKIDEKEFLEVCNAIAKSRKLGIFHGMGFTQHINSLENVHTLLNLAILKDAYLLALRGEINVQGVGDVFASDIEQLKKIWNVEIKPISGNIVDSLILNPVEFAFITEFNPAQSLPNLNKVHKILDNIFLVYLGSYFNLTCEFADVILPIPALFESFGTITNGEQRIRLVRKVVKPNGLEVWKIAKQIAKKFGKEKLFWYNRAKDLFGEIVKAVPWYRNINPDYVYKGKDAFARKKIKHRIFYPEDYRGKDERRTRRYPLLLTTFREMHHFLTSEITENSKTLVELDKDRLHIFISREDAKKYGIKDDDKIRVISKSGEISGFARISDKVPKGIIATRFHYKEMLVNKLFPSEFDDVTYTPNYKCCAVRIEKNF